jgi:hypothetical protein
MAPAEWALGMPPVPTTHLKLNFFSFMVFIIIFSACAVIQ